VRHAAPPLLRSFGEELAGIVVPYVARRARTLGEGLRAGGAPDTRTMGECARLGLGLGVVAAACGIEVLRGRRERHALASLIELLAQAQGLPSDARWRELPELTARAGAGWEAPILVGWTWLTSARVGQAANWSQERARDTWWFRVPCPHTPPPLSGGPWRWQRTGRHLELGLPGTWVA
jgi:hypothetical protein